jgi:hypothetical protein
MCEKALSWICLSFSPNLWWSDLAISLSSFKFIEAPWSLRRDPVPGSLSEWTKEAETVERTGPLSRCYQQPVNASDFASLLSIIDGGLSALRFRAPESTTISAEWYNSYILSCRVNSHGETRQCFLNICVAVHRKKREHDLHLMHHVPHTYK